MNLKVGQFVTIKVVPKKRSELPEDRSWSGDVFKVISTCKQLVGVKCVHGGFCGSNFSLCRDHYRFEIVPKDYVDALLVEDPKDQRIHELEAGNNELVRLAKKDKQIIKSYNSAVQKILDNIDKVSNYVPVGTGDALSEKDIAELKKVYREGLREILAPLQELLPEIA